MARIFRNDIERSEFLYQVSALLEEGYTLSETLTMYQGFTTGDKKNWIQTVYRDLAAGEMFSERLSSAGLSKELTGYLIFMEKYGDFHKGLRQTSEILKKRYELKGSVRKIIHYPLLLLAGLILMGAILVEGVLPQFELLFVSMDHSLPWVTSMVLSVSHWFRLPYLAAFVMSVLIIAGWFRRKPVYEQVEFAVKIPVLNRYFKHLLTYFFASQLAPLLKNGFSLFDALKIIEEDGTLPFFQKDAKSIRFALQEGEPLSEHIGKKHYYLPQLRSIILLGESKGSLGEELERFARYLFERMYEQTYRTVRLFQPLFLCLAGGFILVLFLSMMLPVFSILEAW